MRISGIPESRTTRNMRRLSSRQLTASTIYYTSPFRKHGREDYILNTIVYAMPTSQRNYRSKTRHYSLVMRLVGLTCASTNQLTFRVAVYPPRERRPLVFCPTDFVNNMTPRMRATAIAASCCTPKHPSTSGSLHEALHTHGLYSPTPAISRSNHSGWINITG